MSAAEWEASRAAEPASSGGGTPTRAGTTNSGRYHLAAACLTFAVQLGNSTDADYCLALAKRTFREMETLL